MILLPIYENHDQSRFVLPRHRRDVVICWADLTDVTDVTVNCWAANSLLNIVKQGDSGHEWVIKDRIP